MMTRIKALPSVSIAIPTYNGAKRIHRALRSILDQKYPNIEIIISDNCSTDNTRDVVLKAAEVFPEIRYIRQSRNLGLLGNFEFTLAQARGDYFMWVSDDDQVENGALLKYVHFLENNPAYSLVSGQILYWQGDKLDYVEGGFTLEDSSPVLRTLRYYTKVIYGGMFHGMARRSMAAKVPTRKVFGNDFHFSASLAYLGKVKNFDEPGYNKYLGGFSRDIKKSAKALGESDFAANFPRIKIAYDAFAEVLYRSPIYASIPGYKRGSVAILCFLAAFFAYYGKIFPLTIAGKLKRLIYTIFGIENKESIFKKRSQRRFTAEIF